MDKHRNFSKNLEAIRKEKNMTFVEFSRELGVPKATLQSVIKEGNTTLDTAIRISEGVDVPLDVLLSEEDIMVRFSLMHAFIKGVNWYQTLSAEEQDELIEHVNAVFQLLKKK